MYKFKKVIGINYNYALLLGISGLVLLFGLSAAQAQGVVISGQTVTVPGSHSSPWNIGGSLIIGNAGDGNLIISDGGIVSNASGELGNISGFAGRVTVMGAGSQWNNNGVLYVGSSGTGELTIENGGAVSNTAGYIGRAPGSSGTATVTGTGSLWNNNSTLTIGLSGAGELIIADNGRVMVATDVQVAASSGSIGTLNIGASRGQAAVAPGVLDARSVIFGAGTGEVVFNHTVTNYVFDAAINNGASNAVGSGTGLVGTGLVEAIAGRTILNAYHGDFTGTLQVRDGGILQINNDMSHVTTLVLAGGTLEGNGIVSSIVNEGTIAPGNSIGTLTIAGNYTGNNGVLNIKALLGGDNSPTSMLMITGDVSSGTTPVVVTNLGGLGAETVDGIRIIEIAGASPNDAFMLRGDYVTETGQQAVIGGAYAYTLRHNSEVRPNDGNWYLTSETIVMNPETGLPEIDPETGLPQEGPRYQPGVPLYEQYPQVLASLNTVPTLQQRVGNRGWMSNGVAGAATDGTPSIYGAWGRIEGTHTASDPARSKSHAHRDTDLWKLQTGFDFGLHQGVDGSQLIGGVNISYGTALADIASRYGRGKIDATGAGIGATLTWYGANGFYVDGQAQVMWFSSDITSTTEGRKDVKGNDGQGYVLSAETDNRYELGNGFSLTPQVQLVYAKVDFDSFTDPFGARVSLNDGDSLRGRFGVSLDHEAQWVASDGTKSRSHLYGIANLYNEFLDGTRVEVSTVRFATRDERLWAGIGIGGTYEWGNGVYAVYGNANIAGSVKHMSDSYAFGGILGFRTRW